MKTAVLIPAHNEARQIGRLVAEVKAKGLDVIVVDDGSADRTYDLASQAGALVLRNEPRRGKGFSLKRGFAHILAEGYDGVIAMDGDGQHDPSDLPAILKAASENPFCLVNGTRLRQPGKMPLVRRVTNRFMSWLISRISGQIIEDTQCGYRYIAADVLKKITLESNDFEIETEVLLKASRTGCRILSVPVQTIYRDEKSKINPVKDTIRFFSYILRDSKNQKAGNIKK